MWTASGRDWRRRKPLIIAFLTFLSLVLWIQLSANFKVKLSELELYNSVWVSMDDSNFVEAIRSHVLLPPDYRPYNLTDEYKNDYDDVLYSSNVVEPILTKLFRNMKGGVFLEAGAYDGEEASNTLYLERQYGWSGLLVEPIPQHVQKIRNKHRNAWLAPVCLSEKQHIVKKTMVVAEQISHMEDSEIQKNLTALKCDGGFFYMKKLNSTQLLSYRCNSTFPRRDVTCFPLYSLLLAAGLTNVDFFSLDVEGDELPILKTLPFHKVSFQVIMVEVDKLENRKELINFLSNHGYVLKTTVGNHDVEQQLERDLIFVNAKNKQLITL